jgi:hypothetical protein
MKAFLPTFFGLLMLAGCELIGETPSSAALTLQTDREAYRLSETGVIVAHNRSGQPLYYSSCMDQSLQELFEGNVTNQVYYGTCDCVCIAELRPGQQARFAFSLTSLDEHRPPLRLHETVQYQYHLGSFFTDRNGRQHLDDALRFTNSFHILR